MSSLQNTLLSWFSRHGRPLPWRQAYEPYHIWISEVMLQQTQMERGVEYFTRWLERFPDIAALAGAGEDELFKAWEGLGYYSRARNLLKAARIIMAEHGGLVPADYKALLNLPGIGPYTAGAIMSLAFNQPLPIVDANIERLFARLFDIAAPVKEKKVHDEIKEMVRRLLPPGKAREFNQALMELGALVCKPREPRCDSCPLADRCEAKKEGTVLARPLLPEKKKSIPIIMATGVLLHEGKIFIQKRMADDIWGNLWEFPGGRVKENETPLEALVREYREETGFELSGIEPIIVVLHTFTIYRVTLHGFFCRLTTGGPTPPLLTAAQEYRWVTPAELSQFAFPAGHRKLIDHLFAVNGFEA